MGHDDDDDLVDSNTRIFQRLPRLIIVPPNRTYYNVVMNHSNEFDAGNV